MARRKPQERRTNGIQPAVTPFLEARPAANRSFERLYRKHVHAVYRYSLAVLQNEADAEDATQTTFLNAYRAFERGERPRTPHNWLIKIAHNVCRQRFRDSSRRPREVEFDDSLATAPTESADVPTATELRHALGFLAFNQRAALVMRELEGRSYAEIAQVLDVSVAAVETLMFRARRALREQLEGGLTCHDAEQTLSRLQSRKLSSAERGALRAHLRGARAVRRSSGASAPSGQPSIAWARSRSPRRSRRSSEAERPEAPPAAEFGIGLKVATVLAAGLVVTATGHEPLKARATDVHSPAANRLTAPARKPGSLAPRPRARASSGKGATRQPTRVQEISRAHGRARETEARLDRARPERIERPGPEAPAQGPPPLHVRLPVQTPPVRVPELPVHLPPLPPPPSSSRRRRSSSRRFLSRPRPRSPTRGRVRSRHGTREQAQCPPRLGCVDALRSGRRTEGEVRGPLRRLAGAEQAGRRG